MEYTDQNRRIFTEFAKHYISQFKDVPISDLPWIETYTGKKWRHLNPQPEDVSIFDIAHSLAGLNRYTGHLKDFYSVAQHSVLVSKACNPEDAFKGLLHDASEAYCNDLSRPFKRSPGMEVYKIYENMSYDAICRHFNISSIEPESVKKADMVLLATEKRDLFSQNNGVDWGIWSAGKGGLEDNTLKEKITPWTSRKAEKMFLKRFDELQKERSGEFD